MPDETIGIDSTGQDQAMNNKGGIKAAGNKMGVDIGALSDIYGSQITIAGRDIIQNIFVQEREIPSIREEEAPVPGESPYKGLQYFDVEDADLFFGRGRLTARLVERLKEWRFLAVVGASGSGKSSLVRAGLVPALQSDEPLFDGILPPKGSQHWQIRIIKPTARPLRKLAACLIDDPQRLDSANQLEKEFAKNEHSLDIAASMMLNRLGGERLLLVVDQFEELFTECKHLDERKAFIDNLINATAEETSGATLVVITLRADFYHHCARYDHLRGALESYQAYIGAMTQDELRLAIEEPLLKGDWEIEEGLVDLMLRDVGDEPGALPLLSQALSETWKRRKGRTMTLAGYQSAGGVQEAIAKAAENVYQRLTPKGQAIAKNIFLRLTELGEGTQATRRRASLDELVPASENPLEVGLVLKVLADERLVTTFENYAEVAHEALIREWPTLRRWLDEDLESLRIHRHLTESAQDWESMGRDVGDLYRGARLVGAQEWAEERGDDISELEREFLEASQREEQRGVRMRWLRLVGIASLVGLVLLVVVLASTGRLNPFIYRPLPMDWVTIPSGEFLMGSSEESIAWILKLYPHYEASDFGTEQPQHPVYLDEFEIMAYEVTNAQYAQCVKAGICLAAGTSSTESAPYPVIYINWYDAQTFCEWAGARLPSEAEWEKAARGGLDGKRYPWGDEIPVCWYGALNGAKYDDNADCNDNSTEPVGSYAPNGYGLYDMAGNVWEWVDDWYDVYPGGDPEVGYAFWETYRVLRGGSWGSYGLILRVANRYAGDPDGRNGDVGFRCARSP